jgi:hypothetical protein
MELTLEDIWNALTPEEKNDTCLAFWQSKDPESRQEQALVLQQLAPLYNFRPVYIERKSPAEKAKLLLGRIERPVFQDVRNELIQIFLLKCKGEIIRRFLDTQGIPHTNGLIDDNAPPPTEGSLRKGVASLLAAFPRRDAALYLGFSIACKNSEFWANIEPAVRAEMSDLPDVLSGAQAAL